MAITKTQAFQISDGSTYSSLELAQRAELYQLLEGDPPTPESTAKICAIVYANGAAICEILRATGRKARAAKGNGATRRKRKTTAPAKETT